jgi:uncharacterized phiE125 gp8 family phage protein
MKYLEVVAYHDTQVVSTADLKTHLRITFSDDDTYIAALEKAAVQRLEEFANIFLLETTLRQFGNTFNDLNILFKSPIKNGTFDVKYKKDSSWVAFGSSCELVQHIKPPRIYENDGVTIPDTDDVFQAWRADYIVGWGAIADIPDPIIQAIKITVSDMYENRQSVIVGKTVSEIPRTAQYLINPYKIQTL